MYVCASLKVVGSQARILYANEEGRVAIALAFNKAVGEGKLKVQCVHVYTQYSDLHTVSGPSGVE